MEVTEAVARKVAETVNRGLDFGQGDPVPGRMCVEAAVCYAMGLPHGDKPPCVSPALQSINRTLNDAYWSSRKARARGMVNLALLQLGTDAGFDDQEFARRLAKLTLAKAILPDHRQAIENAAKDCEALGTKTAAAITARAAADAGCDVAHASATRADVDRGLQLFAQEVEHILIGMGVPGVRWLGLGRCSYASKSQSILV